MQDSLHDILLSDIVLLMEHGQMSMFEALKMSLNFVDLYDRSQAFDYRSKIMERDTTAQLGLYKRLDAIIKILTARR